MTKYFEVTSKKAAVDASISIKLTHLPPLKQITIETKTISPFYCINAPMKVAKDTQWRCVHTFKSDKNGIVDLATSPAIDGIYNGVFPMGCVSFLVPDKIINAKVEKDIAHIPLNASYRLELTAYDDQQVLDKCELERFFIDEHIQCERIEFDAFKARYFYPKNKQNLPAIIIVSGSEGGIEKAQAIAQLLANKGYATVAIGYFDLLGTATALSEIPLEIIEQAIHYLKSREEIDKNRIGIYGRSKGAEFSLVAASYFEDIKCVVVNSPTSLIFEGMNKHYPSKSASWTYQGMALPYFKFKIVPFLISKLCGRNYPDFKKDHPSSISVENINGPILLLAAKNDEVWNSYEACVQILKRLEKNKFHHDVHYRFYDNSGHMLTIPYQPNNRYGNGNVDMMQDTIDAWHKTIAFFDDYL